MIEPQSSFKLWLMRKKRLLLGVAASLAILFCVGLYFTFWRQPIPTDVVMLKGTRVIVSRSPLVFFLEGYTYYLRAWCPGSPKSVAMNLASLLSQRPYVTADPDYIGMKRRLLWPEILPNDRIHALSTQALDGAFIIPTYIGPPKPTSEGYTLSYEEDPTSSCSTTYRIWPDGQNSQIEVEEFCGLP